MKINAIFEVVPEALYSVRFDGMEADEFARLFPLWSDADYLRRFFKAHYDDLLAFWEYMSVDEAVDITRSEARKLENSIIAAARSSEKGDFRNLSTIFRPLHRVTWTVDSFEKSKAKGFRRRSWLRMYAVRLDVNRFVISGGAIKLTRTMNEREHLNHELIKLDEVCHFLRMDQDDEFGFFELL